MAWRPFVWPSNEQVVWTKHNEAQVSEVTAAEADRTVALLGSDAQIVAGHVHGLIGGSRGGDRYSAVDPEARCQWTCPK